MDILEETQRELKLVYELQTLKERISSAEHQLELLKERRATIFVELRNLSNPVAYDELANLSGMSTTHAHKITKQAKREGLQRKIDDGSIFTKEGGLSLQEQVELYNSQRS